MSACCLYNVIIFVFNNIYLKAMPGYRFLSVMTLFVVLVFIYNSRTPYNMHGSKNTERSVESYKMAYDDIQEEGKKYSKCIEKQLGDGVRNSLALHSNLKPAVEFCVNQTRFRNLPIKGYKNIDETKYYLHDIDMNKNAPKSVVLTLGVGRDVLVEQQLKKILSPNSEFFSADPMLENDEYFSPIGYFYPFAVGKSSGMTNATVLTDHDYKSIPMMHIGMMPFLTRIVRRDIIDMFLMDNEGPEYDIQPMMGKGKEFDKSGITVCQINEEFHDGYLNQLHSVLMNVFKENRFIPVRVFQKPHVRIFMLNIESTYCVNRYLAEHFLRSEKTIT